MQALISQYFLPSVSTTALVSDLPSANHKINTDEITANLDDTTNSICSEHIDTIPPKLSSFSESDEIQENFHLSTNLNGNFEKTDSAAHIFSSLQESNGFSGEGSSTISISSSNLTPNVIVSCQKIFADPFISSSQILKPDSEMSEFKSTDTQMNSFTPIQIVHENFIDNCASSGKHSLTVDYCIASAESNAPGEDRACVKNIGNSLRAFAIFDGHGG